MDDLERSIGSMFYVRKQIKGIELNIEICEDNVFTTCPKCGKEHSVNLAEIFAFGDTNLYTTKAYCPECSSKIRQKYFFEKFREVM